MWQVLYFQMSSCFPGVFFQGWLYTQMGLQKNKKKNRKWFIVLGDFSWFMKHMDTSCRALPVAQKKVFVVSRCHKYKNVGQFDLPSAFRKSHLWWGTCQYCSSCLILILQISVFQQALQTWSHKKTEQSECSRRRSLFEKRPFYWAEQHKWISD